MNKHVVLIGLLLTMTMLVAAPLAQAQTDLDCGRLAPANAIPEYYVGLGNVAMVQGDYTAAVVAFSCALARDESYAPAHVRRGLARAVQGDTDAALADYEAALALDDTLVSAYNNRGLLYTTLGNFGLAITDFTLALALDPFYVAAYNNRAVVHAAEGNYDMALADLEQAMTIDPDYAMPYVTLGSVYAALALDSYDRYWEMSGKQAILPGGEPDTILNALAAGRETGNFSAWLAFLTPDAE